MGTLKQRVDRHLNPEEGDAGYVDTFIIFLIACNVIAVMLETEQSLSGEYASAFHVFEWFSSIFFTIEYALRSWIAPMQPEYEGINPWRARFKYAFTAMAMVDLIAILPFYLPMLIELDLRIVRAIRLLRLVRILKMGRYAHAVKTLTNVIGRKREELAMTGFVLVMLLTLTSSAMYFVEHEAQPDKFRSIPEAMWWSVITLTSVGFGDVYPVTQLGKFIGALVAMMGVGFVALPTGILAAGFNEEIREQKRGKDTEMFGFCPHCGKQLLPGEELE